jgi:NitT/TauT family transport system ATP-binding protein
VTHDITEAAFLADRILVLGEGRIHADFPVSLSRPRVLKQRYEGELSSLCAEVRAAMEEVIRDA